MRFGTSIFLLSVTLIAFGFVMSDDWQAHKKNKELSIELQTRRQQVSQTQENLNVCEEQGQEAQRVISQQETDITSLRSENAQLRNQNNVLLQENTKLKENNNSKIQTADTFVEDVKPSEILLGVILVAQITFTLVQKNRLTQSYRKTDYVRLTPQERELIVRSRRRKKA